MADVSPSPDVAAMAKLANDFAHAVDAGDLHRIVDLYSPAAIPVADGEPAIDRHVDKTVANRWRETIDPDRAHMAIRVEDVDVSGDLAYDRIGFTVTITPRIVNLVPGQTGTERALE